MAFDGHAPDFQPAARVDPLTLTDPRERLEYLRDFLRQLPAERFDMTYFSYSPNHDDTDLPAAQLRNDCGTTACIAGWATALFTNTGRVSDSLQARELLSLSQNNADLLFYANASVFLDDNRETYWGATPAQAADVLDHLIATGEVDWSVARKAV